MSVEMNEGRRNNWVIPVIALVLLSLVTLGLWFVSVFVTGPAVSKDGPASTVGYTHLRSIYGSGPDRLHRPTEVAADSAGKLYVADSFKHRVVVFDNAGAMQRTLGGPADVDGALKYPSSVEVDARGRVYVTSSEPGKVVIFNPDGTVLKQIQVDEPLTLAISGDRLYIATAKGILIGDLDGNQVGQMLSRGKAPGEIDRPTGMAVDEDGTIYLADSLNYRFQAIDSQGKSKWVLGNQPDPEKAVVDRDRTFGLPSGLALADDGVLYGIDAFNGEILAISTDGQQLGSFGGWGRQDGQFYYPSGITQVSSESFAIADTFNDRVQIVNVPSPRPTVALAARRSFPWFVPALLAAAIVLLIRRPVAVVTDARGLRAAHDRGMLSDLIAESRGRLYVPAGTLEKLPDLRRVDDRLEDALLEVELETDDEADPLRVIARELRGRWGLRRVAVAFPTLEQATAAEEDRIGILGGAEGAPIPVGS